MLVPYEASSSCHLLISQSQELRPQDSIPFLRRVSTDLHKSDAVRFLAQLDIPDSPVSASPKRDAINRRTSTSSVRPGENEFSPREHSFVKTTFSKRAFPCTKYILLDF